MPLGDDGKVFGLMLGSIAETIAERGGTSLVCGDISFVEYDLLKRLCLKCRRIIVIENDWKSGYLDELADYYGVSVLTHATAEMIKSAGLAGFLKTPKTPVELSKECKILARDLKIITENVAGGEVVSGVEAENESKKIKRIICDFDPRKNNI